MRATVTRLFLEEVFKCLPRIHWSPVGRRLHGNLRRLHVRRWRRVFLYRHSEFVESAIVLRVFRSNTCRDGLCALKLRARIEKPALFAAMQLKSAFRAFPIGVKSRNQHRPAIGTARPGHRPHHARRPRPKVVRSSTRSALRRLAIWSFFFFVLFRVAIAAVAVLAIHKRLRPSVSTDCNFTVYLHHYREDLFASCIQSGCYNRLAGQPSPMKCSWIAGLREQEMGQLCL